MNGLGFVPRCRRNGDCTTSGMPATGRRVSGRARRLTAALPLIGIPVLLWTVSCDILGIKPAIGLSPTTIELTAIAGGADPSPATVQITAVGTGSLTGLSTTTNYSGSVSGWVVVSLDANTAPTAMRVQARTGALQPGSYSATILVLSDSASNSPQEVNATFTITSPVAVSGVSVSPISASLVVGNTQQLTATITPANATNQAVTWSTSAEGVATVSATGLVTAVAAGAATITATSADGGKTATCSVTVTSPTSPVAVSGVSVSPITASLVVGNTRQLTATIAPANATNQSVTWSTSAEGVATVSATGFVSAVSAGGATITATSADGGFTAVCTVSVTPAPVAVSGVSVSPISASLVVGNTRQLTATIAPANATNQSVTWSTSAGAVATVSATGFVSAVSAGGATITARTADGGFTATCNVSVEPPPAISLSASTLSFSAYAGSANPPASAVVVTNSGGGILSGLSASVSYGSGPAEWLSVSLDATTAPATLTLQPLTGSLSPGAHQATVSVSSSVAGTSPREASVTFELRVQRLYRYDGSWATDSTMEPLPPVVVSLEGQGDTPYALSQAGGLYTWDSGWRGTPALGSAGAAVSIAFTQTTPYALDATGQLWALGSGAPYPVGLPKTGMFDLAASDADVYGLASDGSIYILDGGAWRSHVQAPGGTTSITWFHNTLYALSGGDLRSYDGGSWGSGLQPPPGSTIVAGIGETLYVVTEETE